MTPITLIVRVDIRFCFENTFEANSPFCWIKILRINSEANVSEFYESF